MALETIIRATGMSLSGDVEARVQHQLSALDRRLAHHPAPKAWLVLTRHREQRQIEVDLRVELGPLGSHLVSHQAAETVDRAVRLAVDDAERQLERVHAVQRGEPSFGVPSRRLPRSLRPSRTAPSLDEDEDAADHREA
jgi:ribosome-associated translation inhibitor RaiA